MAFQRDGSNNVIAFAEAEDLKNMDQRFFEKNEITFADSGTAAVTLNDYLDILCQRATDRITTKMQASPEWNTYTSSMNLTSATSILPPVNKNLILGNLQDWTDLCVSYVFKEYDATLESDDQKVNYRKNRRTRGKRFITRVR